MYWWATPALVHRRSIKQKWKWLDANSLATQASYLQRGTIDVLSARTHTSVLIWSRFAQLCVPGRNVLFNYKFCQSVQMTYNLQTRCLPIPVSTRTLPTIGDDMCTEVLEKWQTYLGTKWQPERCMLCSITHGHLFYRHNCYRKLRIWKLQYNVRPK
jgi:hypothetical protein